MQILISNLFQLKNQVFEGKSQGCHSSAWEFCRLSLSLGTKIWRPLFTEVLRSLNRSLLRIGNQPIENTGISSGGGRCSSGISHCGIWIRERLLGGGIPDVPITVDAQLPRRTRAHPAGTDARHPGKILLDLSRENGPVGPALRDVQPRRLFRTTELDQSVVTTGEIIDYGAPALDGPVEDALDMIAKLSESQRVEQVFVRHAFRYWMGRNETRQRRPRPPRRLARLPRQRRQHERPADLTAHLPMRFCIGRQKGKVEGAGEHSTP